MNIKSFSILLLSVFFLQSCRAVDTTNPQASPTIKESITNGLFLCKLRVTDVPHPSFIVIEAWIEKIWFNKMEGAIVKKEIADDYQLLFKVKQTTNHPFLLKNVLRWSIIEKSSNESVGIKISSEYQPENGIYICMIKNIAIDTFEFDAFKGRYKYERKYLGKLKFVKE